MCPWSPQEGWAMPASVEAAGQQPSTCRREPRPRWFVRPRVPALTCLPVCSARPTRTPTPCTSRPSASPLCAGSPTGLRASRPSRLTWRNWATTAASSSYSRYRARWRASLGEQGADPASLLQRAAASRPPHRACGALRSRVRAVPGQAHCRCGDGFLLSLQLAELSGRLQGRGCEQLWRSPWGGHRALRALALHGRRLAALQWAGSGAPGRGALDVGKGQPLPRFLMARLRGVFLGRPHTDSSRVHGRPGVSASP